MAQYISGSLLIDPLSTNKITPPQGRLTLTTNVPVLTATVNTSATVRYTPFNGNKAPIWNGTSFEMRTFTELVNTLADSTDNPAAGAAAKVYDLFLGYKNGNLILARDVAWTNDTTPVGSSTTPRAGLNRVQGILVNENVIANVGAAGYFTYVGTIRTDAGGATVSFILGLVGTAGWMGLWTAYQQNQIQYEFQAGENTATWNYNGAVRKMNNTDLTRIDFIRGLAEEVIQASAWMVCGLANVASTFALIYALLDGVTVSTGNEGRGQGNASSLAVPGTLGVMARGFLASNVAIGWHFIQGGEQGDLTNNFSTTANSLVTQGCSLRIKA